MLRYKAIGCEVWDMAWSNPAEGSWTAGLKRENVVTRYPSPVAAHEAAISLNNSWSTSTEVRLANFRRACEEALAENERKAALAQPMAAWVEGIDLDNL